MKKLTPVNWIDEDLVTVHDLGLSGLPYELNMAVPYHEIDIRAGLQNKAREHSALTEDVWMDYAIKMDVGSPFKPVVLYLVNDGVFKYGVAHGNHRLRAYAFRHNDDTKFLRSAKATVAAYIIQTKHSDDVEEFERLANGREGIRQNRDYAIINAVWLVQNRSMTHKAASDRTGIPEREIGRRIQANETSARIQRMGVNSMHLTPSHLERLGSLKHDSHLKHLASIASDGHLSSEGLSKMVTQVKKLRTEAKGNEYIHDEYNRRRREHAGPTNGREPPELRRRRLFLKALRNFEDMWLKGNEGRAVSSLSDVGIAPQDRLVRQEVAGRLQDLIKIMQRVARLKEKCEA